MAAFDEVLYDLIRQRGLSLRGFAERVGYPHTAFSAMRAGERPAPLDRVPAWAEALGLEPGTPEWQRFFDLAALTQLPDEARVRMEMILQMHESVKEKHAQLARLVDELNARTPIRPRGGGRAGP